MHIAPAGISGPVMVPLAPGGSPNFYTGFTVLTSTQVASLLKGDIYVNIHTSANPGGEIRGQLISNIRRVYAFDLCGDQEVPANTSPAEGAAAVTVDALNTNMSYLFIVDAMSGPASAAHIHNGAIGMNGPVLKPLMAPAPTASGVIPITGNDATLLETDNTYLNVHTAAFPGGEVRGQVRRMLTCSENVGVSDPVISDMTVSPNPTSGHTEIRFEVIEAFEGQLIVTDLTGRTLFSEQHAFAAGTQILPLNMSALPAGLYVAQIKSAKHGIVGSFKMVRE